MEAFKYSITEGVAMQSGIVRVAVPTSLSRKAKVQKPLQREIGRDGVSPYMGILRLESPLPPEKERFNFLAKGAIGLQNLNEK